MADAAKHIVVVRHEPFGAGFDVAVEPAPAGTTFDRECGTAPEVKEYAQGLKLHRNWQIRDLTGEVLP